MSILFLLVFGFYFLCLLALLYGWERMLQQKIASGGKLNYISVIIPIRNEQDNIAKLVESLQQQQYPTDKLQVILVNDHSNDGTNKLLTNLPPHFLVVDLNETSGKKAALTLGVETATGEIIVTTDADCQHQPQWLQSINNQFANVKLQLLIGGVAIQGKSFFAKFQAIEFSSLIGSGSALLQLGFPTMANGANLAFRKSAFAQVQGYEGNMHIASGDDEFLMRKIHKQFPEGIAFNHDEHSVVATNPLPNMHAFLQQRIRWASKWKHNSNMFTRWVAVLVFLFQVGVIALFVSIIICPNPSLQIVLFSKIALDGIFLWRVSIFLKSKFSLLPFLVLEFIYPVYVIATAVLSQLTRYTWKGRTF